MMPNANKKGEAEASPFPIVMELYSFTAITLILFDKLRF